MAKQNIELKVRVSDSDWAAALAKAPSVAGEQTDSMAQWDQFYGRTKEGQRLKLRVQITQAGIFTSTFISYSRADKAVARPSTYTLLMLGSSDAGLLDSMLKQAYGTGQTVCKRRYLFLHENTRIHFDTVTNLGHFVEFEYVVGPDHKAEDGPVAIAKLLSALHLEGGKPEAGAYEDLLSAAAPSVSSSSSSSTTPSSDSVNKVY